MGIDLEEVLENEKVKSNRRGEDEVLAAFKKLLENDNAADERVLQNIFGGDGRISELDIWKLEPAKIFTLSQIQKLCTNYRLRFLDASHFNGEIPNEAISKIKRLQKSQNQEITGFKMLAPASMFHLEQRDKDPLLFIPLGNDRYYFVHKWGRDLHPLRKLLVFPFRNFKTLLFCVLALTFAIAFSFPDSAFMAQGNQSVGALRGILFFYVLFAVTGLTALYGFSRVKNFNAQLWDSRFVD